MNASTKSARQDADGNPYWTFRATDALLEGNRRIAFPEEVAAHLGCKPGVLTRVTVEEPADCRKLKICLERGNPPRTIVLNLAEPLKRINTPKEQLIDLVVTANRQLALRPSLPSSRSKPGDVPHQAGATDDGSPPGVRQGPPSPWGAAPTPLLPRWYFDSHGDEKLPRDFTKLYPPIRRIRDLERFWQLSSEPPPKNAVWALRDMAARLMPPAQLRILEPGFGIDALDRLPLMNRTRNCVRRGLGKGALPDGTVGNLMRLPNFGITSLLDLMCVLEAAPNKGVDTVEHAQPDAGPSDAVTAESLAVDPDGGSATPAAAGWQSDAAQLIATAARELRGAATVGDLLRLDLSDLITAADAGAPLDEFSLEADGPTVASLAIAAVDACLERMSETQRTVVLARLATSPPTTLQDLAKTVGLSRERVRQLHKQVAKVLEEASGPSLGILALTASERLGHVTSKSAIEELVVEQLPEPSHVACADSPVVTRWVLLARLGYECRDGLCLSPTAAKAATALREAGPGLTDDAGLIDEQHVRELIGADLQDNIDSLIRWLGWHRLSEQIAPRDTRRARVKAALLKIGAPATKAELAEEGGLTEGQVGAALSSIASVARADKTRWGLREWIDDVYEGIPAEIVQRINEDGGSTRLNRLLDELPRMFDVNEGSIWTCLNTPAFNVDHGWVTEATGTEVATGRLIDVINGHDPNGDPYWTFVVHARYMDGYSLQGVPPAVAAALDCGFGAKSTASVHSPAGCQDISVIWRKTSMHGPEIGRLGPALRALEARQGDAMSVIIHSPSEVSFARGLTTGHSQSFLDQAPRPEFCAPLEHLSRTFSGVTPAEPLVAKLKTAASRSNSTESHRDHGGI